MPSKFTFGIASDGNNIEILYDATGQKLRKTVKTLNVVTLTQDYLAGIELKNNRLEAIYNEEGRAYNTTNATQAYPYTWRREYNLKDHLGNTRVVFCDKNNNGVINDKTELLQENHYYPFGMSFNGAWYADATAEKYKYLYNGKELNEDFGLNLSDYGARWYDAAVGRWWSVDPVAEMAPQLTPYRYGFNNPVRYIDPSGMYEIGSVTLSNEEDKKLKDDYKGDKKGYKAAKEAAINEKKDNIRNVIAGVKQMLDDNKEVSKLFQDFSGVKEGSKDWDNMWNENGKGVKINVDGNSKSGGTSEDGKETTIGTADGNNKAAGNILHEFVHVGQNSKGSLGEGGIKGYDISEQRNSILNSMQASYSLGYTKEGWIGAYGPSSGYKILDNKGNPIGVEVGYAFERFAFGKTLTIPSDYAKIFQKYVNQKK